MKSLSLSLKAKMALAVSLLFVLVIVLLAWGAFSYLRTSFKKTIGTDQFTLVSTLAEGIDDKLHIAQNLLIAGAHTVPPAALRDANLAQRFLDDQAALLSLFDNGLFLITDEGKMTAESPYRPARRGRDISFREFYKETVASGKPYISRPYTSTHTPGHPAIMLTVPLFDPLGHLVAILGGSFDLWGENFLQKLAQARLGTTGYYDMTDQDRTIIINQDKSRILTQALPVGANPLYEQALAGFEGSGETVNARGERVLTSIKQLQITGWILAASLPITEAYAPLEMAKRYFFFITMMIACVVLLISWLLMERLIGPLLLFTRHVEKLSEQTGMQPWAGIASSEEIRTLALAFNHMVISLESQQAALRESEEKFAKAFLVTPTILTISALADGRFIEVNDAFEQVCGYNREECIGRTSRDLALWEELQVRNQIMGILLKGERVQRLPISFRTKSGKIRVGEFSAEIIELNGESCLLSLVNDITVRKETEQEIVSLNAKLAARASELEAANQELEAFNYTVSHDLRTPLNGIHGYCELLLAFYSEKLDPECTGHIRTIKTSAEYMSQLISTLLDFSRLTRCEVRHEEVDFSALTRIVAEELRMNDPNREVTFIIAEDAVVNGDAELLRIVMENLLGNAWKYTGHQQTTRIEFGCTKAAGAPVWFVRDNGPGFDMANADKLFLPFQRLPGAHEFKGHGIGLATVRRIVELHNGRIWAESVPGLGATFYFSI